MSYITGQRDLNKAFERIADVDIRKTFKKWAEYVRSEAVDLCPVDTGELQQSIMTDVTGHKSEVEGIVYTNKEYAPYVEFGTGRLGASSSDVSPYVSVEYSPDINGQAAQPFLYPALNNNQTRILRGIRDDLQHEMEG